MYLVMKAKKKPVPQSVKHAGGYTISHRSPKEFHHIIEAHHKGKRVGRASFYENMIGNLTPKHVQVNAQHRRKGVATAMYRHAKKRTKLKIDRGEYQTHDGIMFRKRSSR